jgi:hypothetical protein
LVAEVLVTFKDDGVDKISADISNVAELVTLVYSEVAPLINVGSSSKHKKNLAMNIAGSYYIHKNCDKPCFLVKYSTIRHLFS